MKIVSFFNFLDENSVFFWNYEPPFANSAKTNPPLGNPGYGPANRHNYTVLVTVVTDYKTMVL